MRKRHRTIIGEALPPLPPGEGWGEGGCGREAALGVQGPLTLTLSRRERGPEGARHDGLGDAALFGDFALAQIFDARPTRRPAPAAAVEEVLDPGLDVEH